MLEVIGAMEKNKKRKEDREAGGQGRRLLVYLFIYLFIFKAYVLFLPFLFIWLRHVLVAAGGLLSCGSPAP